jgi:hypothetical protein
MRILFSMAHAGHARNFESTLRELADRGHEVDVVLERPSPEPGEADELLDSLLQGSEALHSTDAPPASKTDWREVGIRLRATLDYLHYLEPDFEEAPKLRERAGAGVPGTLRRAAASPAPWRRRAIQTLFEDAERSVPRTKSVQRFLQEHRPDAVLVTPLVDFGAPQLEYVRCARELGIPSALPVASWDNLLSKGRIHDAPDLLTVWNEWQRQEAVELHAVPPERIAVTGPVAYQHWLDWQPSSSRQEFCGRVGLDPERPFVLYLGSTPFVAPDEAEFAAEWVLRLREHSDPDVAGLQVLLRPHPMNPLSGKHRTFRALAAQKDTVVYPAEGQNPTDRASRSLYYDSIHHSAGVVGINTSALLEAVIVGRRPHVFLTPRYRDTQLGAPHFRRLLERTDGLIRTATSLSAHAEQLAESVGAPGLPADRHRAFLESFFAGWPPPAATARLTDAVEAMGERGTAPSANGRPLARRVAGRSMALGARTAVRHLVRQQHRRKLLHEIEDRETGGEAAPSEADSADKERRRAAKEAKRAERAAKQREGGEVLQ